MQSSIHRHRIAARVAACLLAAAAVSCGIEKQSAPPLSGPSELGLSLSLAATPDRVARDGVAQSVVTVRAFDETGRPKAGQWLLIGATPGSTGLSATELATGADGIATFTVTAPPFEAVAPNNQIVISVTPRGDNASNVVTRTIPIGLIGTPNSAAPTALFTFTPDDPNVQQVVVFDASTSTDEGVVCGSACTYDWNFGDGSSGNGLVATHTFAGAGTFAVTLTVTDSTGASGTSVQGVDVGAPAAPEAAFVISPTSPGATDNVVFNAATSTVGEGATIVSYAWNFGDGATGTGASTNHAFAAAGTYNVVLTITDNLGRTDSAALSVTVVP